MSDGMIALAIIIGYPIVCGLYSFAVETEALRRYWFIRELRYLPPFLCFVVIPIVLLMLLWDLGRSIPVWIVDLAGWRPGKSVDDDDDGPAHAKARYVSK